MKIIFDSGPEKIKAKKTFVAIGVFDGLHLGHQSLIKRAVNKAQRASGKSVVMTFDPHPVHVLHPEIYCPLLISLTHRIKLIEKMGVDFCWVVRFTMKFSKLSPEEFIRDYLVKRIHPGEVFLGDDFRFGKNRSGDLYFFREAAARFGFKVKIVSSVRSDALPISSTRIRKLVSEGNLLEASRLLGRKVSSFGTIVKGDARGKSLGFPTANVHCAQDLLPPSGVYLVHAIIDGTRFNALANIGTCPSFNKKEKQLGLEVYILDFDENIYGKEIFVEFIKKLREEVKFSSVDQLVAQIRLDEIRARKYFHSPSFSHP